MDRLNKLDVFYHDRHVGTMALYQNRLAAFEYSKDWIMDGYCHLHMTLLIHAR